MSFVKRIILTCLVVAIGAGCRQDNASIKQAETSLSFLKDNQAKVLLTIGEKPFYSGESVFTCQMIASSNVLNMTLTDQFDGRTMISIVKDKWYAQQPLDVTVVAGEGGATSLKIGKLVDKEKMVGEGYMMTEGTISVIGLDREKVILEISGKVGPYSDFHAPEKLMPLKGIVVCKKPAISFGDVSEKEVFGSTHSN